MLYRASRLEGILGFSVVSMILADLLGNRQDKRFAVCVSNYLIISTI